jgi:hypothetical protein
MKSGILGAANPPADDISEGPIVAVKIASTVLDTDIWLAFKDSFKPDDGEPLAVFYAYEIPILAQKTPEQLREIHKVKLAFPGCRVIQEGPEGSSDERSE